jgi:phage-related protein
VAKWLFRQYQSANGRKPVEDWLSSLTPEVRQTFATLLRNMAKMAHWQYPEFKRLKGNKKLAGLGEIRVSEENKQYRLIGMTGPGKGEYTLLIGCSHKQQVYTPKDAKETANARRKLVEKGAANVVGLRITQ